MPRMWKMIDEYESRKYKIIYYNKNKKKMHFIRISLQFHLWGPLNVSKHTVAVRPKKLESSSKLFVSFKQELNHTLLHTHNYTKDHLAELSKRILDHNVTDNMYDEPRPATRFLGHTGVVFLLLSYRSKPRPL